MCRIVLPLCLLILPLVGCGGVRYQTTELQGKVVKDGQPLPGVCVQFHPDPEADTKGPSAIGETDQDGSFTLRYALPGETTNQPGVVIGAHKVTLADTQQPPIRQGSPPPHSRIPLIYQGVHSTPLRLEVNSGMPAVEIEVK
ncbi:hypothetical protein NA78x_004852 [Anatilimnocola sp. NA78]|uniref:hypothetical protein n=1 Tax=Anatilimnocola sp. NA78 TaxID=3415683 RepID=UPI003CE5B779